MPSRKPLSVEVAQVRSLLIYTLLFLLVSSAGYFFLKTSSAAERGYSFKETQLRQKNLESENRILKQRVLDAQSITELKKSEVIQEMITPASEPTFIAPKGPLTKRS